MSDEGERVPLNPVLHTMPFELYCEGLGMTASRSIALPEGWPANIHHGQLLRMVRNGESQSYRMVIVENGSE